MMTFINNLCVKPCRFIIQTS